MSTTRFVFHQNPTVQEVIDRLETTRGLNAVDEVAVQFTSLVQVLNATTQHGATTTIHEPDGNNVSLVNVSKHEFERAAYKFSVETGLKIF